MPKTSLEIQLSPSMFNPKYELRTMEQSQESVEPSPATNIIYLLKKRLNLDIPTLFDYCEERKFEQLQDLPAQTERLKFSELTGKEEPITDTDTVTIQKIQDHLTSIGITDPQVQRALILLSISLKENGEIVGGSGLLLQIQDILSNQFKSENGTIVMSDQTFSLQTVQDNQQWILTCKGSVFLNSKNIGNYDFQLQITKDKKNQVKIAITQVSIKLQSEDQDAIAAIEKIRDEFRKLDGAVSLEKPDGGKMIYVDPPLFETETSAKRGLNALKNEEEPTTVYDYELANQVPIDVQILKRLQTNPKDNLELNIAYSALDPTLYNIEYNHIDSSTTIINAIIKICHRISEDFKNAAESENDENLSLTNKFVRSFGISEDSKDASRDCRNAVENRYQITNRKHQNVFLRTMDLYHQNNFYKIYALYPLLWSQQMERLGSLAEFFDLFSPDLELVRADTHTYIIHHDPQTLTSTIRYTTPIYAARDQRLVGVSFFEYQITQANADAEPKACITNCSLTTFDESFKKAIKKNIKKGIKLTRRDGSPVIYITGKTLGLSYDSENASAANLNFFQQLSVGSVEKCFRQGQLNANVAVGALNEIKDSYIQQKNMQQTQLNEINNALLSKIPFLKRFVKNKKSSSNENFNNMSFVKLLLERIKLPFIINRAQSKLNSVTKLQSFVNDKVKDGPLSLIANIPPNKQAIRTGENAGENATKRLPWRFFRRHKLLNNNNQEANYDHISQQQHR